MQMHTLLGAIIALFVLTGTAAGQATPANRSPIRSGAPSGDDSRQYVCRGATIPAGFIVTDDIRDRQLCGGGNVTTLNSFNVWVIERFDRLPVNSMLDVCAAMPIPTGWVLVDVYRRKDRCGHPDGMFDVNVKRIRRTQ